MIYGPKVAGWAGRDLGLEPLRDQDESSKGFSEPAFRTANFSGT